MSSDVAFSVSAPGKIILVGEHSLVYKKKGVAVAIDKRTTLVFKERRAAHDQITINLKDLKSVTVWDFKSFYDLISRDKPLVDTEKEFTIDEPEQLNHDSYLLVIDEFIDSKLEHISNSIKNALRGLFYVIGAILGCSTVDLCPFDIEVSSELVLGAGSGSSAAFAVCVAAAFYHYLKLKALAEHGPGDVNICHGKCRPYIVPLSSEDAPFTAQDCNLVNKWAYAVEMIMHGKPSGVDNTVCTFGGAIVIRGGDPNFKAVDSFPSLKILLIDTRVERSTKDQVGKVAALRDLLPETVDAVLHAMDTAADAFLRLMVQLSRTADPLDAASIYRKLEGLVDMSHGLLSTLGVSHPRLEEARMITSRRGLHTKLTGAGGGGLAFSLLAPDTPAGDVTAAAQDLAASGYRLQQVSVGGPGLKVHPL